MQVNIEADISLFNLPRWLVLFGEVAQHEDAIRLIGARGLQYASVVNYRDRDAGRKLVESGVVQSFHQSFVQRGLSLLRLAMPTVDGSLDKLEPLETRAKERFGSWLPVIVHPNQQYLGDKIGHEWIDYNAAKESGKHGPMLHQPTVEVLDRWKILSRKNPEATAQDMLDIQTRLGFDSRGVALDLHHIQSKRGEFDVLDLDWCIAFAGELATLGALDYPGEVQVAFRPDFGGQHRHLAQAVNGEFALTPHGQMFKNILEHMPITQENLRVTLEIPPKSFNSRDIGLSYIQGNRLVIQAVSSLALAA